MYINESITKYIEDLAAKLPAPGGGSASGLSGALGTALLEMVCNFTAGKEKYKDVEQDILQHLDSLNNIRREFILLIDEDVKAYTHICSAFKSKDKKIIDKALKDGYYISLKVCELSKRALGIAMDLPEKGNANLLTDVGCGAELLKATFNSGVFNAEINLKGIEDKDFVSKEKTLLDTLKKEIEVLYKDAVTKTKKRME
ncbi:MAG: cyclodeaminase/cyclohydrolase family protein [Candidatus Omnitrophica bacterium]|nr:cyclodeaminase/cyclohydrolase family protein [Candidatus Omnitrophota bacterium]MBU1853335.1 cyclodeaminase/cyclohydrolase family protein [Candidatus Omnitrophota bacterium]